MAEDGKLKLLVDFGRPGSDRTVGAVMAYASTGMLYASIVDMPVSGARSGTVIDGVSEEVTPQQAPKALPSP